jgi:hypothetical protein
MWQHYVGGHTGYAIEYGFSKRLLYGPMKKEPSGKLNPEYDRCEMQDFSNRRKDFQ